MKKIFLLLFLLRFAATGNSQSLYFPPIGSTNWDTLSLNTLGWCQAPMDSLLDYLGQRNTKAFMLLQDGKIVVEKYYGSFTRDSLWYWASAGKTLTAFATGLAQQNNLLQLNDSTSQYLGNGWTIAPPAKEGMITVWHQLTMTSGLDDGVPDNHCTIDTCLQYLADAGTRWAYHNGPYTLLDSVLQSATGQTLNTWFTQQVKTPTGMTGLFVKTGFNNVYISNARSMARFGLLILNRGKWNTAPIMTDTAFFNAMVNTSQALNPSYGYLWWLNGKSGFKVPGLQTLFPGSWSPNAPADMIAAMGKNGQMLNVVPSKNLIWLRMGDVPNAGEVPFTLNDTIWQKLNPVFCTPAGTTKVQAYPGVRIHPNPAHDQIWVEGLAHSRGTLRLMDGTGRIVLSRELPIDTSPFPLPDLCPGLYFIQIIREGLPVHTERLLLQHP
jgi:CubicO group peptidase (beta-lactamase class C family)